MIKFTCAAVIALGLFLQAGTLFSGYRPTELIDTPTAQSVDFGSYLLSFRLYGPGSVVGRLQYGIIMRNLTLGLSLNAENVVGDGNIDMRRPFLYAKIPLYSGDNFWPALSFGFDEQGYGMYHEKEEVYEYDPIGFFMVASQYGILPGMNINLGVNSNHGMTNASDEGVFGFGGIDFMVGPEFMALAEFRDLNADGIGLNMGLKYLLSPELSFELNFIEIGGGNNSPSRILKILYSGDF